MSGTKLLLDTNIVLYYLGGDTVLASLLDQREVFHSLITEMEMLGYPRRSTQFRFPVPVVVRIGFDDVRLFVPMLKQGGISDGGRSEGN